MNNEKKIVEFVSKYAKRAVKEIKEKGYLSGGKNGPYNDNETPLRISSHWIKIFSWLFQKENNNEYLEYIKILANYISSQAIYVDENIVTFCSRNKKNKDHVNGTIGNAWIIEGLVEASKVLNNIDYYNLSVKVFLSFQFNEKLGIWNRYEIDGRILGYDETFNHQLWLAVAASEIISYKNNEIIKRQLDIFLNKLNNNKLYRIHKNGLIKHFSYIDDTLRHKLGFIKNHLFRDYSKNRNLKYKEEGYHYFALYGLACLKNAYPEHSVFKGNKINKSIEYAFDKKNYERQMNRSSYEDGTGLAMNLSPNATINIYCFPYNSPTFELPFIVKTFTNKKMNDIEFDELWNYQTKLIKEKENNISNNINDYDTLIARIYELLMAL